MNMTQQIQNAAQLLKSGGVVAFPTETVYGLGANGLNEKAVAKIFDIKKRPHFDPLILHIADEGWLDDLVENIPPQARKLIEQIWPGPLTVVLPKKETVPDIVTSGMPNVAVRMPLNNIARQIVSAAQVPIAAPSANLFGSVSPTTAEHVREQLGGSVNMIIDGGPCAVGIESTIVSFVTETPALLRPGGLELEKIEEIVGPVKIPAKDELVNQSPGRGGQHYSPNTSLKLVQNINELPKDKRIGFIFFSDNEVNNIPPNAAVEILSPRGDMREAACSLFSSMRKLDSQNLDLIAAFPVPSYGLGLAINDRLSRAAMKRGEHT
ncbi:MAG: L-threonylcarbamoyladenylate synthase [Chitinispirillaceae bacterium]